MTVATYGGGGRRQDVILTPEEYRKFMSATAGRNPLATETAPIGALPFPETAQSLGAHAR